MRPFIVSVVAAVAIVAAAPVSPRLTAAEPEKVQLNKVQTDKADWLTDYPAAMAKAEARGRMMLVWFHHPQKTASEHRLESEVFARASIGKRLGSYVCVELPLDARIKVAGEAVSLLDSAAFAGLEGRPGIAVVDLAHRDADYYGCAVTTLPVVDGEDVSSDEMAILLDLPPGGPAKRARLLAERLDRAKAATPLAWHDDYTEAIAEAERERRMLLVVFCAPGDTSRCDSLASDVLANPVVREKLGRFVRVKLPLDATILAHGKETRLIDDPAFAEMLGRQGIAILDFAHQRAAYHGPWSARFRSSAACPTRPRRCW